MFAVLGIVIWCTIHFEVCQVIYYEWHLRPYEAFISLTQVIPPLMDPLWWKFVHPPSRSHMIGDIFLSLQWRHNAYGGVSNHQPCNCLLNHLFGRRSKKTSKLYGHKWSVTRKMFPFDDVIMLTHWGLVAHTSLLTYGEFGSLWSNQCVVAITSGTFGIRKNDLQMTSRWLSARLQYLHC